jgi:membrane protein YdbS with pleckstrin-like domain
VKTIRNCERVSFVLILIMYVAFTVLLRVTGKPHHPYTAGWVVYPVLMLVSPCADPLFGTRRRLFWVRQTLLIIGGVLILGFSLWP